MSKAKWPREAQVFRLSRATNKHWCKGDIVELLEVGRLHHPVLGILDYAVRHYCQDGHAHDAWAWSLEDFYPLTETARAMLAIAKACAR